MQSVKGQKTNQWNYTAIMATNHNEQLGKIFQKVQQTSVRLSPIQSNVMRKSLILVVQNSTYKVGLVWLYCCSCYYFGVWVDAQMCVSMCVISVHTCTHQSTGVQTREQLSRVSFLFPLWVLGIGVLIVTLVLLGPETSHPCEPLSCWTSEHCRFLR